MSGEISIEEIQDRDYSNLPREQIKYVGQDFSIRYFDPTDGRDAKRLKQTIESPRVQAWMEDLDMTDQDFLTWMDEKGPGKARRHHLFSVSGSDAANPSLRGETVGFVYFYYGPDEKKQMERVLEEGVLNPEDVHGRRILEVSYAKSPDAPPRMMTGAIQQACLELSRVMQRKGDMDPKNMMIVAYVEDGNGATNDASAKVTEAAGFIQRGVVTGYGERGSTPNRVYTLDWDKVHQSMQQNALELVQNRISDTAHGALDAYPRSILYAMAKPLVKPPVG
jgi:hypothetical protein